MWVKRSFDEEKHYLKSWNLKNATPNFVYKFYLEFWNCWINLTISTIIFSPEISGMDKKCKMAHI